jgi:hypothetical protein
MSFGDLLTGRSLDDDVRKIRCRCWRGGSPPEGDSHACEEDYGPSPALFMRQKRSHDVSFVWRLVVFGFSAARHPRGIIRPRPKARKTRGVTKLTGTGRQTHRGSSLDSRKHGRAIRRAVGLVAPNVIVVLPIRRASCLNSRGERSRH